MKLGAIPDPFAGEKLVAIHPRIAPFVAQEPRLGRLHYFPGRHLTKDHLQAEQDIRTLRLQLRGRSVTSGVVTGLETTWRDTTTGLEFLVQPGHALAADGTDIVVGRSVLSGLDDLLIVGPGATAEFTTPEGPFAAILLIEPGHVLDADLPLAAQVEDHGADFTPCPRVPDDEVFYKTTRIDAARLVLYVLPPDFTPATPASTPTSVRRNLAAWKLFDLEARNQSRPWLGLGVPLALVGFDANRAPAFLDRHAVARRGGRPRVRHLAAPALDARFFQARFDHFCAHLGDLTAPDPARAHFRHLPPVGLLPRAYLTLEPQPAASENPPTWRAAQTFFPASYALDVSVVPTEQLDALIADHRTLAPYDLNQRDAVRFLLPVAQQFFDPDLLQVEVIDPAYDTAIANFRATRGAWLARRIDLGGRRNALTSAADGTSVPYPPSPDPKQLENPELPVGEPPGAFPTAVALHHTTRAGTFATPAYTSDTFSKLRAQAAALIARFTFNADDQREFSELFAACGLTPAQTNAAFATAPAVPVPAWLAAIQFTVGNDPKLSDPEKTELRTELLAYLKKQISVQAAELAFIHAPTTSVQALIERFTAQAEEADELVDAGFLKVRTDVYRLGQLLTNNSLGTKFATSPALANIIERKPPKADTAAVNSFASQLLANFASASASSEQIAYKASFIKKGDATDEKTFKAVGPVPEPYVAAPIYTQLRYDATYLKAGTLSQNQIRAIPLERLQPALAPTVRQEIHDGRLEIFERLTRLDLALGDLTTDFVDAPGTVTKPATPNPARPIARIRFQTLIARRQLPVLAKAAASGDVDDADESKNFASGVSFADMAVAALRAVEGRIKAYRAFVADCHAALRSLRTEIAEINLALSAAEHELDEARQDVAVALALKIEEQARIDGINTHRAKVLANHVEFLVFHRPRALDTPAFVASRPLQDALATDPVLDAFRDPPPVPADLAALRDTFRASPAKWFVHAPKWLGAVDRWEHLRALLARSAQLPFFNLTFTPAASTGRYQAALATLYRARHAAAVIH
ncbi:MAG: hypothetical protein H7067_19275, partial [Burkholderiales bacterium]|nr:hypothetical protein [Opitutaceae bacterium]